MLRSMWLYVTEGCNLRCRYCFNRDELFRSARVLDIPSLYRIVDSFLALVGGEPDSPDPRIVLFGGEPTLHPEVIDRVLSYTHQRDQRVRFLLITNGTRLGELSSLLSRWAREYHFRVQLSIDAVPGEESERASTIGRHRYDEALRTGIGVLKRDAVPFSIRATLTPAVLHRYAATYRSFVALYDRLSTIAPSITMMPDFVRSSWEAVDERAISRQAREIVAYAVKEFRGRGRLLTPYFMQRAWRTVVNRERGVELNVGSAVCGFAHSLVGVAPDGEAYACHRGYGVQSLRVGNLCRGEFDFSRWEALRSVVNSRAFTRPGKGVPVSRCRECSLRYACAAVCPAESVLSSDGVPQLRCNSVLYRFQRSFLDEVERTVWSARGGVDEATRNGMKEAIYRYEGAHRE